MKVGPVSGDLVVELAIAAAAIGGLAYLVKQARDKLPSPQAVADALNPTKDTNLAYGAVNALGNTVASTDPTAAGRNADGSWTLGGWAYDVLHGGQVTP